MLPKPDLHVYLSPEDMYWLRVVAEAETGGNISGAASVILAAELRRRAEVFVSVSQRLVRDGYVPASSGNAHSSARGISRSSKE